MATILTVDDSASIRQMVQFTLKGAGHTVIEAGDGKEGLEAAKKQKVALVLTDINMPNMNGIELIKALRALPDYKFTPIRATGWLVKPFNPQQLLDTIAKVLP
jgi:two-component system, chemotaxis family, chemotaxis protein CheY